MVQLIIFGAVAWFAISMMKDLIRASEQKQKDIAAKDANEARVAARAAVDAAREDARAKAQADKAAKRAAAAAAMAAGVLAEDMVTCAICGVHTAIQESITTQGKFYCSEGISAGAAC